MRRLALIALLCSAALPALARDITGQLAYRERIALDPGAEVVVELRGAGGVIAELRAETAGAQVPLPFALSTEDPGDLTLRAAVFVGGLPLWVTDAVAVGAGEAAVDLGTLPLQRHVPMGFSSKMRCGDTAVEVGFVADTARLRVGSDVFDLSPVTSASGARFSDGATPETGFWSKGNRALVTLKGTELPECLPVPTPSLLPFTARGNEPGWVLTAAAEGVVLSTQDGEEVRTALPAPEAVDDGVTFLSPEMAFTATFGICRDDMTGMPHPLFVSLIRDGETRIGCGGEPASLLDGAWRVEMLNGAALPAETEVTLEIADGSLSGSSGCNRYFTSIALSGEGLSIGQGGGTMMACPDDQMATEQAFLAALPTITRFDIDDAGRLVLLAGDTALIIARK